MKDKLEGLLAETLFSQLLCLPHSRHKALAYSTIMVLSRCASRSAALERC